MFVYCICIFLYYVVYICKMHKKEKKKWILCPFFICVGVFVCLIFLFGRCNFIIYSFIDTFHVSHKFDI